MVQATLKLLSCALPHLQSVLQEFSSLPSKGEEWKAVAAVDSQTNVYSFPSAM